MLEYSFNLIDEKWFEIINNNGDKEKVGLRDVLINAHEILEITDSLLTVEFSLYRLLTVIIMDIFRFEDICEIAELMEEKKFKSCRIDEYLNQWHNRFDLFDDRFPFLQTPVINNTKIHSIPQIIPHIPYGNNYLHFHHQIPEDIALAPEFAARLLVAMPPFTASGGPGLQPSLSGTPPCYILVNGRNLFETILLNCITDLRDIELDNPPPLWRRNEPIKQIDKVISTTSLLEGLFWPVRHVKLMPEGSAKCYFTGNTTNISIRNVQFVKGWELDKSFNWIDPNSAYTISKKGKLPVCLKADKEIWRDVGPMMFISNEEENETYVRPRVVNQFAKFRHYNSEKKSSDIKLTIYGVRYDKAKVFEWQKERLTLPERLLTNKAHGFMARSLIKLAEEGAYSLSGVLKKLVDDNLCDKTFSRLILRNYWQSLKQSYFNYLYKLSSISPEENDCLSKLDDIKEHWKEMLFDIALKHFNQTTEGLNYDGKSLIAVVENRRCLKSYLIKKMEIRRFKKEVKA